MALFRRDHDDDEPGMPDAPDSSGSGAGSTLIGQRASLEGKIVTSDDICIQGQLHGTVESKGTVLIPKGGKVNASVAARNVAVHGELHGDIAASEQAELGATGSLVGGIHASSVVIRPGATFKGTVKRLTRAAAQPASTPTQT